MADIMRPVVDCDWYVTPREAIAWQEQMRRCIRLTDTGDPERVRIAAGADVAYSRRTNRCYAATVLMDLSSGDVIDQATAVVESTFPYVPGLLTFREGPALVQAFAALPEADLLVFDGQGLAHPRRFGLACHMGVLYDRPSLGVAKSKLCGDHDPPGPNSGDAAPLLLDGEHVGWALRSRAGCKPIYVSPGHRVSVDGALALARRLIGRYRIPEITRQAHLLTRQLLASDTGHTA
jgi:deoxyribonuclease V